MQPSPMQPPASAFAPPTTAFGVPLDPDERVVFAHVPPPVSGGERAIIVLVGTFFLPIVVGIFIIIHAFMKKSDRVWFVTNKRAVKVTGKGAVTSIKLENVVLGVVSRASETIELRFGVDSVPLPTKATVAGMPMIETASRPGRFAELPAIQVPP